MRKGFTLIELLVVVLIIGILAAVAVPQYTRAVDKSRLAELQLLTKAIKNGQELYFLANNAYTTDLQELDIEMPADATYTSDANSGTATFSNGVSCTVGLFASVCGNAKIGVSWQRYFNSSHAGYSMGGGERCIADSVDPQNRANKLCKSMGMTISWTGENEQSWIWP